MVTDRKVYTVCFILQENIKKVHAHVAKENDTCLCMYMHVANVHNNVTCIMLQRRLQRYVLSSRFTVAHGGNSIVSSVALLALFAAVAAFAGFARLAALTAVAAFAALAGLAAFARLAVVAFAAVGTAGSTVGPDLRALQLQVFNSSATRL